MCYSAAMFFMVGCNMQFLSLTTMILPPFVNGTQLTVSSLTCALFSHFLLTICLDLYEVFRVILILLHSRQE